ncbi:type II secretion system F family protein [Patescibacteria group bacterium]
MAEFIYNALDKTDSYVNGKIEASNVKKATEKLESEGFLLVNIKLVKHSRYSRLNHMFEGVSRLDKIFFTRHLYTMLESGMAMDQAVKITSEQTTNQKFREILTDIYKRVQKGQSFHSALGQHPKYFSSFFINLIKVGENSGKLDDALSYLLEQQEKDYDLLTQARGAMVYPIIIIAALVGMVTLMMTFVVPQVTSVLIQYEVELPFATKVLIGLSNFLLQWGLALIPVLGILIYVIVRWTKSPKGKKKWDTFLLKIPQLKKILMEFNLARFTRALSSLLKSGVMLNEALDLTAGVSNNSLYQESQRSGIIFIQKGIPLADVLKGYPKLYPSITSRMIEVGERTGKLDHMLTRLAIFYEKSVSATIKNLASIIEPTLLLLIGFTVGFVAIAVLTPIWKFSETI